MIRRQQIEIEVGEAESARQLHQILYKALDFPNYYGANWDAFWDMITEGDRLPHQLVLHGWKDLEERQPREARLLRECLDNYEQECPEQPCRVVYA